MVGRGAKVERLQLGLCWHRARDDKDEVINILLGVLSRVHRICAAAVGHARRWQGLAFAACNMEREKNGNKSPVRRQQAKTQSPGRGEGRRNKRRTLVVEHKEVLVAEDDEVAVVELHPPHPLVGCHAPLKGGLAWGAVGARCRLCGAGGGREGQQRREGVEMVTSKTAAWASVNGCSASSLPLVHVALPHTHTRAREERRCVSCSSRRGTAGARGLEAAVSPDNGVGRGLPIHGRSLAIFDVHFTPAAVCENRGARGCVCVRVGV